MSERSLPDADAEFARIKAELRLCGLLTVEEARIEQAKAQVAAQLAREAADRAADAAKQIDSEEMGRRWFAQHFCLSSRANDFRRRH